MQSEKVTFENDAGQVLSGLMALPEGTPCVALTEGATFNGNNQMQVPNDAGGA